MKTYKSIAWSYPTSTNATKAGFAQTGCYSVEIRNGCNPPKQIRGFATKEQAEEYYDALKAEPCPVYERAKMLHA